jgi:hypothetical protein
MSGFVQRWVLHCHLFQAITLGALLFVLFVMGGIAVYCKLDSLQAPPLISAEELIRIADARGARGARGQYVSLEGPTQNTGLQLWSAEERELQKYLWMQVADHWVLIETDLAGRRSRYDGYLVPMSTRLEISFVGPEEARQPDKVGKLLPVVLHAPTTTKAEKNFVATLLLMFPVGLYFLFLATKTVLSLTIHKYNPVWRELWRHGEPAEMAKAINQEVASDNVMHLGNLIITENWIIHRPRWQPREAFMWLCFFNLSPYFFWVFPLTKLIWYYPVLPNRNVGKFITTDLLQFVFQDTGRGVAKVLHRVHKRVPWVCDEYDSHYANLLIHHPDRFVRLMRQRESEYSEVSASVKPLTAPADPSSLGDPNPPRLQATPNDRQDDAIFRKKDL